VVLIIDGCDFAIICAIVDYRDNRHLGDSTIVKFTIAIYRDNRQYRASLAHTWSTTIENGYLSCAQQP